MEKLTEEQKEKMRAKGFEPLEYLKEKIVKRPKLFVLHGFKDDGHLNSVIKHLEEKIQEIFDTKKELCGFTIQDQSTYGKTIILPEFLKNIASHEIISELKIGVTSYPTMTIPYSPRIFRYMPKEFVDDFFDNGKIRLSSFQQFSKHENPDMKDNEEGKLTLVVSAKCGRVETSVGFGSNSFVLCGTVLDYNHMENTFDYNAGFCIENIHGFIEEINNEIKKTYRLEIYDVLHGPCVYSKNRSLERSVICNDLKELEKKFGFDTENTTFDNRAMGKTIDDFVGHHGLFLKENKYAHEHEYRILWNIEEDFVPNYIDLVVPEAVKFCTRVNLKVK